MLPANQNPWKRRLLTSGALLLASANTAWADAPKEQHQLYDISVAPRSRNTFMQSDFYKKHCHLGASNKILCEIKPSKVPKLLIKEAGDVQAVLDGSKNPCVPNAQNKFAVQDTVSASTQILNTVSAPAGAEADAVLEGAEAGFPLSQQDAKIGPKGLITGQVTLVGSQSSLDRNLAGPQIAGTYNPADNLQILAGFGGAIIDQPQGQKSTSAAADSFVGVRGRIYDDPKLGLSVAAGVNATFNTGNRAEINGLTNPGPVVAPNIQVSKTLNASDTWSFDVSKNFSPVASINEGSHEYDFGSVLAHKINDAWEVFGELDGRRSASTRHFSLGPSLGVTYQANSNLTLGVGMAITPWSSGDLYSGGKTLILGLSYQP
jgi:hypothetical protein